MNNYYAFYQGDFIKENDIRISIRSKAFNYGLACFEGIRAYWDEENSQLYAFKLKEHYVRFLQSCKALNIKLPYTVEDLCNLTVELLRKNNFKTTTYIRPIAFKGSNNIGPTLNDDDDRIVIYCQPLGSYTGKDALSVAVTSWTRLNDNMIPPRVKATAAYLNSALASLEVTSRGYDEAIFLTQTGHVCEGPGENIFMVRKGKLITPPPCDNILEGITRELVMKLAKEELNIEVVERSITRTELYAADELFFSGTAMEVTPIIKVDDREVGNGTPGQVCKSIKELFLDLTVGKIEKYSSSCTPIY
ncbi:branched-chain amino acid aminotransferase [Clostridium tetanomorphum]|mgnify:CR=1 FL=1|uniref:branched-chain amino acid transaminase n=1 Tax=Clostridium tetanomorphum TaxID=1553 RepID=UPI000451C7A3|nr:branched-chain amino acid transaminase [Clostridium tetanomorphum]KAJ51406.1 branched-chain amino acid aminotransferase [Clostridium tetanomorphum DSM 665]MBP1863383.1 branched-chain amino acid aminotransferase [Clostridium tetanomorphum]NRS83480.1 branched-chain amino acid aminotransferase [Clostridium tetanomorphum]SQC01850.1 branched-chain amino acid aminotransferase, group I [Clostridium tetanomorphum]